MYNRAATELAVILIIRKPCRVRWTKYSIVRRVKSWTPDNYSLPRNRNFQERELARAPSSANPLSRTTTLFECEVPCNVTMQLSSIIVDIYLRW